MVSLAGLSAVGKGYQEAEKSYAQTKLLENEAQLDAFMREGEAGYGNTIKFLAANGLIPGAQAIGSPGVGAPGQVAGVQAPQAPPPPSPPGMPVLRPPSVTQPPPPGQASVPMQQPASANSSPQGSFNDRFRQASAGEMQGPADAGVPQVPGTPQVQLAQAQQQPPQQQRPQRQQAQPQQEGLTLENAAGLIAKANPNISPQGLVYALERANKHLQPQAALQVKEMIAELNAELKARGQDKTQENVGMRVQGQQNVADTRLAGQLGVAGLRSSDKAADRESKEYIAANSEEGKKYRAELRATTQKELASFNKETRLELQAYAENGRMNRAELSLEGKKALAAMNTESRERIEASRSLDRGENVRARRDIAAQRDTTQRRGQDIVSEDKAKGNVSREAQTGLRTDTQRDIAANRDTTQRRGQDISSADRGAAREQREGFFQQRDETTRRGQDLTAEGRANTLAQRGDQYAQSEARRVAAQAWKQDTTAQRFEQKHAELEQRAKLAGNRQEAQAIATEARAEHNRVMEYLQVNNMFNTLKPDQKKALAAEINSKYDSLITRLRTQAESTRGDRQPVGGGPRVVPTTSVTRPGAAKPPPADVLLQFNDALKAGKPRDALIQRLKDQGFSTEGL